MEEIAKEYICCARQYSSNAAYSKAFDLYLKAFDKCPGMKAQHEPEFRAVLNMMNELLATANKMEEIFINFGRATDIFPTNIYLLNDVGKYLYKFAFYKEAWGHFQKALKIDSGFVNAEKNLNSVKNLLVERWHFRMLNDKIRNEAYHDAIRETLVPHKDSILDIGTGTGLLSMYAYELLPVAVTALDGSEVMTYLAECITQDRRMDTLVIINNMSTKMDYWDIGGKRSLVITELFDAGLFGEHILQTLAHAWEYLINGIGRVMPSKGEFFVVGAKCDHLHKRYQLSTSAKRLLNIPHLNVHVLTFDETYDCEDVHLIKDIKYMTDPQSVVKIDFNDRNDIQEKLTTNEPYKIEFKVNESGEINIFIGWFNLYLTETITITTDPRSDKRANAWQQAVFFDNVPKIVEENQFLSADFLMNGGKLTMIPDCNTRITRVSPETLRFLNDADYLKVISGCIGMACVYLGQIAEVSEVSIVDLSPFPVFGLQMLQRGARSLVCYAKTCSDKRLIKKVFKANKISMSKVTILLGDKWSQEVFKDDKYHAIFCNIFELCGDVDLRQKDIAQHLKQVHLLQGGLFMPADVKLVGQLVNSDWMDINNRVDDENVGNYGVAKYINKYQVSQNFCIDFTHLEYTALSDPIVLGSCSGGMRSEVVNVPITMDGYANTILCWYNIELMEELKELSTNRSNSFIDGIVFLANPQVQVVKGKPSHLLRCVDSDGSFKLMIDSGEAA